MLWEEIPELIAEAIHTHNDLMRKILRLHHGVLVRNEGDSFMIVFQNVLDGLRFTQDLQERLFEYSWSEELLKHPLCKVDETCSLCGPRFRMAIHHGKSSQQYDVNDQPQYIGKVVNETINVCRRIQGGMTVLSQEAEQVLLSEGINLSDYQFSALGLQNSTDSYRMNVKQVTTAKLARRLNIGAGKHIDQSQSCHPGSIDIEVSSNIKLDPLQPFDALHKDAISQLMITDVNPPNEKKVETEDFVPIYPAPSSNVEMDVEKEVNLDIRHKNAWEIDWNDVSVSTRRIGSGSYGTVFEGEYGGRKVGVKKMLQQTTRDRYFVAFLSELSITRKLAHKNIVPFVGACLKPPNLSIITTLIEPGNLKQVLRDEKINIPADKKLRIIRGVIEGMSYLHSQSPPIIHRDLKTSNILIDKDFNAYLCDFGFARVKVQNQTMTKCGTVAYQAPEILEGKRYNEKADVYSFGIVLWEIETRKAPYDDMDGMKVTMSVVKGLRPEIPLSIDSNMKRLMTKCWAHNSEDRPSFSEMKEYVWN
eukprot:TRINITY_DN207_c0_g1_i7.p1 TRINITY_DN207_c0_g1~~TRINITY_DN207_c0_g1_i7.p1  ORF type:complete len:611 (-),score=168.11 TRINITY_DN207_c0_g1_i7:29-1627(-)